jgi:hypothetical protein
VLLDPLPDPDERDEGEQAGSERDRGVILHYPIARATIRIDDEDLVLWLDASRGRVLAENIDSFRSLSTPLPPTLLAGLAGTYFGAMLLLPLPWSIGAALVATPFLHRWGMRMLRGRP